MHDIKGRFSNDERLTRRYIEKVDQGNLLANFSAADS